MIAVHDIGVFAALAFNNFDQYRGMTIELAGDELTLAEIVGGISRVTGLSPKALAPTTDVHTHQPGPGCDRPGRRRAAHPGPDLLSAAS
jgi:hypothetical protein